MLIGLFFAGWFAFVTVRLDWYPKYYTSTQVPILPYALAFAAGAMIYVVVEELIPEGQQDKNTDIDTIGTMIGFTVMMVLDVALG